MRNLLLDTGRLLLFQLPGEKLKELGQAHFYLGLLGTWLAGVGRYWDHPKAELAQTLGLGSLGYIFLLSALLWGVIRPVAGPQASYWNLVTFVSLTSFPAWLYAIPVEKIVSIGSAIRLNVWFLALVAGWRVALLVRFVRLNYQLGWWRVVVCCLLPMTAIIFLLAALNLEHAVFEIMGGLRNQTPGDGAYLVIILLSFLSVWLFPVLLIAWGWFIYARFQLRKPNAV